MRLGSCAKERLALLEIPLHAMLRAGARPLTKALFNSCARQERSVSRSTDAEDAEVASDLRCAELVRVKSSGDEGWKFAIDKMCGSM